MRRSYEGEPNTWAAQDFGCSEGMVRYYLQYANLYSATIDRAGQQGLAEDELIKRINAIKMADIGPELRKLKSSGRSKVLDHE